MNKRGFRSAIPTRSTTPTNGARSPTPKVAEVPLTAFTSRRCAEHTTARLIVRRVRRLNPAAATHVGQDELFAVYRYHAVFTDNPQPMLDAEAIHRDHAI